MKSIKQIIIIVLLAVLVSCSTTKETTETIVLGLPGKIKVYFNKSANESVALPGNKAQHSVNLENKLIDLISSADSTLDIASYEINLPRLIDTLISTAAKGIRIRLVMDAKSEADSEDDDSFSRYDILKLYLEKLNRGKDGKLNTDDDIIIFADSPIFANENSSQRDSFNLPLSPGEYKFVEVTIGNELQSGFLLADGELKPSGQNSYYSPGNQMHNKFVVVDDEAVFTGSWNFTVTGLYGTEYNMQRGILDGNQQHSVIIENKEIAAIYKEEFETMWGSSSDYPNPMNSKFHKRKPKDIPKTVYIDSIRVDVLFSPSTNAVSYITDLVRTEADHSILFSIFAFSYQPLVNIIKYKWENSFEDMTGERTNFSIRGVFDRSFWNQWWSASVDMTGRTAKQSSADNPNTRWKYPANVFPDAERRKLHSKTMVIDEEIVVVGSANWSTNANETNDENTLIIYDKKIANQFVQEIFARYMNASGLRN